MSRYKLNSADLEVLAAVKQLLKRLAVSSSISPAELISVAKVQLVLSRLPRVTEGVCVAIDLSWGVNQEGCRSTSNWHFSVGSDWLTLSCGGMEYTEGVGSDSFTTMDWSARPDEDADYDGNWDHGWMQRGPYSDPPAYDDDFRGCGISVSDEDNPFLYEADEDDAASTD